MNFRENNDKMNSAPPKTIDHKFSESKYTEKIETESVSGSDEESNRK